MWDSYLSTQEVILELFPEHPETMAAVVWKFFDGCDVHEIAKRFSRPESTIYRWLVEGTNLLKRRLAL